MSENRKTIADRISRDTLRDIPCMLCMRMDCKPKGSCETLPKEANQHLTEKDGA